MRTEHEHEKTTRADIYTFIIILDIVYYFIRTEVTKKEIKFKLSITDTCNKID